MTPRPYLVPLLAVVCLAGCARREGGGGYWSNRWHDLRDVVTGSVGDGWGVGVRASLIHVGGFVVGDEAGLRRGHVFGSDDPPNLRPAGYVTTIVPIVQETGPLLLFAVDRTLIAQDERGKSCLVRGYLPLVSVGTDPAFYGDIEIGLGCWKAVRFGLNPIELVDFIAGFTTLDILVDDL